MKGSTFTTTSYPTVSVIVPAYNAESTLKLCLDAIASLDYPSEHLEVFLVDNGSTDATVQIASQYNVTILHELEVQSSYAARNKGILASKGELLAFTDSDCIVTTGWLKQLVRFWADSRFGCFAGEIEAYQPESLVEIFSDREGILQQRGTLECPYLPYPQTANAAYRRSVFDKIGLFVPEMTSGGDADLAWRMQKELGLKIKLVQEALVYHKHRTSIEGLYTQFKKYEYGKVFWKKHHPDYEMASVEQRQKELHNRVEQHICELKNKLVSLMRNEVDFVDFTSSFLRVLMSAGTFKARVELEKSLDLAALLQQEFGKSAGETIELKKKYQTEEEIIRQQAIIISEQQKRIESLLGSASWRITWPFRYAIDCIKKLFSV